MFLRQNDNIRITINSTKVFAVEWVAIFFEPKYNIYTISEGGHSIGKEYTSLKEAREAAEAHVKLRIREREEFYKYAKNIKKT
jgi:hypothetical protein